MEEGIVGAGVLDTSGEGEGGSDERSATAGEVGSGLGTSGLFIRRLERFAVRRAARRRWSVFVRDGGGDVRVRKGVATKLSRWRRRMLFS